MKKVNIFLLVMILALTSLFIILSESKTKNLKNNLDTTKDYVWERIKNQTFVHGKHKGFPIYRYKGPILFKLNNASQKDSLAFSQILNELRTLIPHQKIGYFDDYTQVTKTSDYIETSENKSNDTLRTDPLINGHLFSRLYAFKITFHFNNASLKSGFTEESMLNVEDNKTYEHFSSFSKSPQTKDIAGYLYSNTKFSFLDIITVKERIRILENVIFKILSAKSFHASDDYLKNTINASDKLLLQRFYSPNFDEDFKNYMQKTYGRRYALNFLDKKRTSLYASLIVGLMGIVVFILIFSLFQKKIFKNSYLNYFLPILCICIYSSNLVFLYKHLTNINSRVTWDDLFIFGLVIVFAFSLISSFLLWSLEKLFVKTHNAFSLNLVLKTLITFLAFSIPITAVFILDDHVDEGINFFIPSFFFFIAFALGRGLLIYLNHVSDSLVKQKDVELSQLKEKHAQSELKLLQSHINPHFLYNALNSIAGLAHSNADKTEKMALSLSDLFRYSLNKKGQKMSTIKEEVTMVENYLDIEKIRFGKRLKFRLHIDEGLENESIPMFILQPLVENAIKHGVSKIRNKGYVELKIIKTEQELAIMVCDNGPNFPENLISGHGLQTIHDLLRLSYGNKASLYWENAPKKHITITINKTELAYA